MFGHAHKEWNLLLLRYFIRLPGRHVTRATACFNNFTAQRNINRRFWQIGQRIVGSSTSLYIGHGARFGVRVAAEGGVREGERELNDTGHRMESLTLVLPWTGSVGLPSYIYWVAYSAAAETIRSWSTLCCFRPWPASIAPSLVPLSPRIAVRKRPIASLQGTDSNALYAASPTDVCWVLERERMNR